MKIQEWFTQIRHGEITKVMLLVFVSILIVISMGIFNSGILYHQTIPSNVTLAYRTVEPGTSGFLWSSGVQYYVFDTNGNRYLVSQSTFDSYKNLPRQ